MAWFKDIAWIKIGLSAAAAVVGFFLVNGLSYLMLTRSHRYPTEERVRSIQAFNACVILYLAIDFLLLFNVMTAQDIGSTLLPRAGFFAILLISTWLSMRFSRGNVPLPKALVSWIWLLLSISTGLILFNKGWFGSLDPRLAAWTGAALHQLAPVAAAADLRLVALAVSLLGPWLLVVWLRYDLHFDTTIDPHLYFQHSTANKVVSIFKEFIKTFTPALLLGLLALWVGSRLAVALSWTDFPALPPDWRDLARSLPGAPRHLYWVFVAGCSVLITLVKALRCISIPHAYAYEHMPDPVPPKNWTPKPIPPVNPPVVGPHSGQSNIFISYKSQDVLIARHVAEQLIASGIKAWFAEYQIPAAQQLKIQNASPEESKRLIDAALNQGLTTSTYGLAFTNDRYAGSTYCNQEIERLLQLGPARILEVKIPSEAGTHQRYPQLNESASIEFCGEIDPLLTFIEGRTNWRLGRMGPTPAHPGSNARYRGVCMRAPFQLDMTGWTLKEKGGRRMSPTSQQGPEFYRDVEGGRIFMNCYFGQETDASVLLRRRLEGNDDRQAYNFILSYAVNEHSFALGTQPMGVHLLPHAGFNQFAITYLLEELWLRKYSILLKNPRTAEMAEFVFTFGSSLPGFAQFCRDAHWFDQVVTSLEWGE